MRNRSRKLFQSACVMLVAASALSGQSASAQEKSAGAGACQPDPRATPAIRELRRNFIDAKINALTFHSIGSIFNTVPVKAGGQSSPFLSSQHPLDFTYEYKGEKIPAQDALERTFTNALIILKDGKIVHETYRNFTGPQTRFLSMSTAKSMTSILVGAALSDGHIKSLDEQVVAYVPELKKTAFDGATIRDLLLMRSGADREDNYQPDSSSDAARLREEIMVLNCRRSVDEAFLAKRADRPGKTFRYSTLNTNILGWALEKATGKPINEYMSERLWTPLGAEADGFFLTDGPPPHGRATNGMGFNAVARDYARLGQMMLDQGRVGKRQIIPADWVRESTVPVYPEPVAQGQDQGYQYQWWTLVNSNAYMAIGLQGQFIYIDPDTRTVVVKLSYFPIADANAYQESETFFRAVSAWKPEM
ncbi:MULTISPECIES: serine hydrolase domain-containing protein [unclassified Sphingobium]|uniref:serine hydrolase domain-containing protein n=1 Tax=unclassified Sphingobium TaxID=2611147 RepID=UPI002224CFC7|nr:MULTISPECIES: serine hydrolase [unclassified Sphingobium]MCW2393793.1 CubicO group peptidase (beta-lactamase class C family) [Sphingobium sp. B8D3B]MCW2417307.1 CubicO group peptidase (beta-lactamase class C family) [Sphingobium sp. B8D3C]